MKYLFSVSLLLLNLSVALAQVPLLMQTNEVEENYINTSPAATMSNRQYVSEWYNYGRTIKNQGGNCLYYKNYLFPDSTVKADFSGSMAGVWKHSYGEVCDPSSPSLINNTLIDANASYSLDSISLQYRYYRFQNQAPDTLVFQIYKNDRIEFSADPWNDNRSWARVNYNYQLRKGDTASYEYTILLNYSDTSTATQRTIYLPVGINISAGQKVAATVTYFPGNNYSIGDTIDPTIVATHRINAFAIYDFKDKDITDNKYFYNNGLLVTNEVRYNYDTLGWSGKYIPGTAYSSGYYHVDMAFKLTSNEVGINESQPSAFDINIFPAVVIEGENSIVQIQSTFSGNAQVCIVDLSGKKVFEKYSSIQSGTNKILLRTETISSGMYLVNVELNGIKQALKLIKI